MGLLNGHQPSSKSSKGPWYSDLNVKGYSPMQNRQVRAKIDVAAFNRQFQLAFKYKLNKNVSVHCATAYPGAHEFGDAVHKRSNPVKIDGANWFMDNPIVTRSISRKQPFESLRSLRGAVEELSHVLDERYPADPRSMLDALSQFSTIIEPRFLFTMRTLASLVNSHESFDGGMCRHGLALAAMLSYFGTITKSLPRDSWRVVWYESMQNEGTRTLFEIELGQWMGWKVEHENWQPGVWRGSTKSIQYTGVLGWAKMVEDALAVKGSFGKLLDLDYQLGLSSGSINSTNEPLHRLRTLAANAEHMQNKYSLDDGKLWDPEWGCSEEDNWYPSRTSRSPRSR